VVPTIDYPPKRSSSRIKVVKYPWRKMLFWYSIDAFIVWLVFQFSFTTSTVLYTELAFTVGFYCYFRAIFKTLYLYPDKLKIIFPAISFRRNKIYNLSEIDYLFFQIHGNDKMGDQYFNIHLKNGKKKSFWLPSGELLQFRTYAVDNGIRVKNSKHIGEGHGF
jgi:hypothetical protein